MTPTLSWNRRRCGTGHAIPSVGSSTARRTLLLMYLVGAPAWASDPTTSDPERATREDGKTVLLHSDGTWTLQKPPPLAIRVDRDREVTLGMSEAEARSLFSEQQLEKDATRDWHCVQLLESRHQWVCIRFEDEKVAGVEIRFWFDECEGAKEWHISLRSLLVGLNVPMEERPKVISAKSDLLEIGANRTSKKGVWSHDHGRATVEFGYDGGWITQCKARLEINK